MQRDLQVPGIADLTLQPLPSQVTWYLLFEIPAQVILVSDTRIKPPALEFPLEFKSGYPEKDRVLGLKSGNLVAQLLVTRQTACLGTELAGYSYAKSLSFLLFLL